MTTLAILDAAGAPQQIAVESANQILTPHSVPEVGGGPVTGANPMPVAAPAVSPAQSSATAITTGGTSQQLFAAGSVVRGYRVQNPSTASESLFIDDAGTASPTSGTSIELSPGACYESPFPPTAAVTVYAATSGHAFRAARY